MRYLLVFVSLSIAGVVWAGDTAAPPGAYAYFISPKHGEVVSSPFKVVFGLAGMGLAPAGTDRENTGHHHLINAKLPSFDKPIPADTPATGFSVPGRRKPSSSSSRANTPCSCCWEITRTPRTIRR